ncbi:MAG: LLM class F420-dependent oxidoreductase [Actinomyces sp.]|nr:MAG: LLM class F420-dependent oxidoreductase [Actinomyces sp.]
MKLGLGLDLYRDARLDLPVERVRLAERLGYHSVWTAEAYGADAFTPLARLAAATRRIRLATGVAQVAARAPAATAMTAMTLDAIAGGSRVIVGLGVSGPQIVEGWYGRPWGSPRENLRDHVAIMRKVIAREAPVRHEGRAVRLPYDGPDALGQGKPLRSILHPHGRIGIWIAAGGPLNTALAAEIADGWLPMGYGRDGWAIHGPHLARGWEKRGGRPADFEIFGGLTLEITDDVAGAIAAAKPLTAMYVGGMGSASHNFHRDAMARRGYAEAAARIQELWLAGRREEAVAAVPDEYIDENRLLGTERRIRSRWDQVVPEGLTGLVVRTSTFRGIELAADLAGTSPAGVAGEGP